MHDWRAPSADLKLENLLPSIIPFASMNKTVVLMGQGMFRDDFRNNFAVFVSANQFSPFFFVKTQNMSI
jgi:hypothetical protein